MNPRYARDGTRLQAGLRHAGAAQSVTREYSVPELGIVTKVHYRDDTTNRSRTYVECDVFLPRLHTPLYNVPVASPMYGTTDGLEWTPREPTNGVDLAEADGQTLAACDGDRVIVDFVGGISPIIRGSLRRRETDPSTGYSPVRADGRRMVLRHGGTTVTILPNGDTEITIPNGQLLKLGNADGTEQFTVRADDLTVTLLDHIHPTAIGNTGGGLRSDGTPIEATDFAAEKVKAF